MKSSRVSRVLQIVMLFQSGQRYGSDDLTKILNIGKRTLFRDLKELGKLGVPYNYNRRDHAYQLDSKFFMAPTDLTAKEAQALLLLVHKVRDHLYFPLKKDALLAGIKIENSLPARIRQYCNALTRNITVMHGPQMLMDSLEKVFSQLQRAIEKKRVVSIQYYSANEPVVETVLSPYHLVYAGYLWYVVGKSGFHNDIVAFKLSRIKRLAPLNKCFLDGDGFDIREYIGKAWSIRPEGRVYNIKLRFLPEIANEVAAVQWHSTQSVTRNGDGSVTLEFRVDGLGEITWWILEFGDQVEVLAPAVLRQRIVSIAENVLKNHKHCL